MRAFRFPSLSILHPLALLTLALAGMMQPARASASPLEVLDPWVRAAPPGAPALAAYAVLHNRSGIALAVSPCETADFGSVSLHETRHEHGVARMRAVEQVVVPAGESVALAPGGMHLMLMAPAAKLAEGSRVAVCLRVGGTAREVPFEVRRGPPAPSAQPPHQH